MPKLWGHPFVYNIYKTKECDELQKFSRQLGMSWRIFCVDDFFSTHFTCLKPGERFQPKIVIFTTLEKTLRK